MASTPPPAPPVLPALTLREVMSGPHLWDVYGPRITDFAVKLVVAAIILMVTVWAARWGAAFAQRLVARLHKRNSEADATLSSFAASLVRYLVVIVGLMAVLEQLGVKTTSVLAVLGAASIAVGLALQGALSNVAAGVMLLIFRPYRVGDYVELSGGKQGTVQTLDLFVTELFTADNLRVVAPNGKIFGDTIVNYSTNSRRRVDVVFHLPPKQDLGAALDRLKALVEADERVLKQPAPIFEAGALNEAYAEGAARVWVAVADFSAVKTKLVLAAQAWSIDQDKPPPAQSASSA